MTFSDSMRIFKISGNNKNTINKASDFYGNFKR